MKLPLLAIPLAAISISRASTTQLAIASFNEFHQYRWDESSIWSNGVPTSNSEVEMVTQTDGLGAAVSVLVEMTAPATIANLHVGSYTSLRAFETSLTVTGGTSSSGSLSVFSGTLSLGTFAGFDPLTKTLLGGSSELFVTDGANDIPSVLEFRGADIEINETSLNLYGENARVLDQDSGLDAFRNFRENRGYITIDDGFSLHAPGDFLNESGSVLFLSLNSSPKTPEVHVAGDLTNAGKIYPFGNSLIAVTGAFSNSGTIVSLDSDNRITAASFTQNDGALDLGTGGLAIEAPLQIYQGNALVTGAGTLTGAVVVADAVIAPGHSAGKIAVAGNLVLGPAATLDLQTGGTAPGESDLIAQTGGTVTLGGTLKLSFLGVFSGTISQADEIILLTSGLPLSGAFANVASGARIATAGGEGTFLVRYGPGSPAPASLTISDFQSSIVPETYAQWAVRLDLPPGQDEPGDDPNGDGISNLEAFFRGIAPLGSSEIGGMTTTAGAGGLTVTLAADRSASGVTLLTEISPDLATWSPGPAPVLEQSTATRLIYQATAPAGPGGRVFLRFKLVEQP